jgi:hypothetical protein
LTSDLSPLTFYTPVMSDDRDLGLDTRITRKDF